ncbi:MAPEG family protein [Pseudoalteromonas fenneropenaei]|uniref:MAPEG family protein n=1 Tax=Pseudoalteromonas fenneropenaei TaxID=1737459 RepID=A0ABV7CMK9_9GAMM
MLEKFLVLTVFAQVMLTFSVMYIMGKRRFAAAKEHLIEKSAFTAMRLDSAPDEVRIADRHFINQFEIPTLFYVAAVTALAVKAVSVWFVAFSLVFVITRYAHSVVHLGKNQVLLRYRLFLIGCVMCLAQWLVLLINLL